MSTIGRFLEFSVRTPDIVESLHFYKTLGFVELEIGDVCASLPFSGQLLRFAWRGCRPPGQSRETQREGP